MWRFILIGVVVIGAVILVCCAPPPSKETIEKIRKAKEKARKFLIDQLPEELRVEFERKGRLTIRSKMYSSRVYELHIDRSFYQVDQNGQTRRKLCINFTQDLPAEDKVLTVLRNIQADEKGFLRSVGQAV